MAKPKFVPRKLRKQGILNALKSKLTAKVVVASLTLIAVFHFRYEIAQHVKSEVRRLHLGKPDPLLSFEEYKFRFPRKQKPDSRLTEASNRRLIFNANALSVGRHNVACLYGKTNFYLIQSPLKADRTVTERRDSLGQLSDFDLEKIRERNQVNATTDGWVSAKDLETDNKFGLWVSRVVKGDSYFEIPNFPLDQQPKPDKITHIDSDLRDCIPEIRDQKNCGACYAFSWVSLAEWHYCKQTGEKIDFSEQHIVDCGKKTKLEGCIAGKLPYVKAFSEVFGFHLERDYPYKAKLGTCPRNPDGTMKVKINEFKRIVVDRDEWEQVLKEQPILLEVHLPADTMSYKRGVHPGTNCNSMLGHGMLLVGYGREEGVPYWLLKNSMGRKWGENGYLRLSREAPMNKCFKNAFVAKFKYASVDEEKYLDFYDKMEFQPTIKPEEIVSERKAMSKWMSGS